jgi:PAS domain S-box-containing protein
MASKPRTRAKQPRTARSKASEVHARRQALESEERYQAFIRTSHEGIWRFEVDQPIPIRLGPDEQIKLMYKHAYLAEANDAMAAMYGLESAEQLIGMRLPDMLVESDPRNTEYLKAFIASGYNLSGVDSHEVDQAGNPKVFRNSLIGMIEGGHLVRAWGTQQDITEQVAAEAALRQSEERLSLALQASRLGMWEWNIITGELLWSDQLKALFGLKPTATITYKKYLGLVHPDDREKATTIIQRALKTGEEYSFEHRAVWPDGSVHWLLGLGKAFLEKGKAVRMIGTSLNIDDSKKAEEDARRTERLRASNTALKMQRQQLMALNNSKDEFISLASHQLRTPATGVKQYIGMLLQGYSGKLTNDQKAFLQIAYESNERELQIIDDLLRVAQVDAGKVALTKTKTDVAELTNRVIANQGETFKTRQQKVTFVRPESPAMAPADERHLYMVLENIIDNASKYSRPGKTIIVRVAEDTSHVHISIEDKGVGIARADIERLFQKFSRIDNPLSTLVGGTGIGLYWAKRIMDLHGGAISVVSEADHGSIFTVSIPKG